MFWWHRVISSFCRFPMIFKFRMLFFMVESIKQISRFRVFIKNKHLTLFEKSQMLTMWCDRNLSYLNRFVSAPCIMPQNTPKPKRRTRCLFFHVQNTFFRDAIAHQTRDILCAQKPLYIRHSRKPLPQAPAPIF